MCVYLKVTNDGLRVVGSSVCDTFYSFSHWAALIISRLQIWIILPCISGSKCDVAEGSHALLVRSSGPHSCVNWDSPHAGSGENGRGRLLNAASDDLIQNSSVYRHTCTHNHKSLQQSSEAQRGGRGGCRVTCRQGGGITSVGCKRRLYMRRTFKR